MVNKCITMEAKNFENKLNDVGISLSQFNKLRKMWNELSAGGQAEVNDMLTDREQSTVMTNTEKLNALIAYISDAERYHLDMASKGSVENGIRSQAIQDITLFMEHELKIPF